MTKVKPIPDDYPRVTPHLAVAGASAAIDFYKRVLDATERMRMSAPDGSIAHAEIDKRALEWWRWQASIRTSVRSWDARRPRALPGCSTRAPRCFR
jgi:hypothetical protein